MAKVKTLCVIDDDNIYQFTVKHFIKNEKLAEEIQTFADGEMAIDFINENLDKADVLPDVILLDINMPVMDGWQFLDEYEKIVDKLPKKIIIYMVSSSVDYKDLDRAKEINHIANYFTKPLKKNDYHLMLNL